jgi:hypothetical protein
MNKSAPERCAERFQAQCRESRELPTEPQQTRVCFIIADKASNSLSGTWGLRPRTYSQSRLALKDPKWMCTSDTFFWDSNKCINIGDKF